jgi:hypothetical protein
MGKCSTQPPKVKWALISYVRVAFLKKSEVNAYKLNVAFAYKNSIFLIIFNSKLEAKPN